MSSRIEALKSMANFANLFNEAKKATYQQAAALEGLDPFQSVVNDFIKVKIENIFETKVKFSHYYQFGKKYCFSYLFPTTQSVVEKVEYIHKKIVQMDRLLSRFTTQHRFVRYGIMGLIAILSGYTASFIGLKPPIIFAISGIFLTVVRNHTAIATGIKDLQCITDHCQVILKQPLIARSKIKELRRKVIHTIYSHPEENKDDHTYHLVNIIRYAAEKIYGTKEEAEQNSINYINYTVCPQLRAFEKKLRFEVLSRITDATLEKITVIVSTQAFRLFLTNLTGLGLVGLLYYLTYPFTPPDQCHLLTPLAYTWNRAFPLNWLYTFSEQCTRYFTFITFSDIIKWTIRLFIWNRMIHIWEKSRETAVQDLLAPVKIWGQTKLTSVVKLFSTSTGMIAKLATQTLTSISNQFIHTESPSQNTLQRKIRMTQSDIDLLRDLPLNLKRATTHASQQSEKRLQIMSLLA